MQAPRPLRRLHGEPAGGDLVGHLLLRHQG
jgi:hypothetical protein